MSDDEFYFGRRPEDISLAVSYADRTYARMHSSIGRVTLPVGDDTQPLQHHQIVGYVGEVRSPKQRIGEFGLSTMPLPGAIGIANYQFGHRGWATIVGVEDPRYRPTGLNPGEAGIYGVTGAGSNGTGGTMWWCLQALLGKLAKLLGITILIGDGNTVTLTLTGQTINITGSAGDVVVAGVSLVHHVHSNAGGTGDSGPPVAS